MGLRKLPRPRLEGQVEIRDFNDVGRLSSKFERAARAYDRRLPKRAGLDLEAKRDEARSAHPESPAR